MKLDGLFRMKHPSNMVFILAGLVLSACSFERMALKSVADGLSADSEIYSADNDPDLVGQAIPFGLKMYESLLAELPDHRDLLLTTAAGYCQYGYAFVQMEADYLEDQDLEKSRYLKGRAQNLFLRARGYAIRGLETNHEKFFSGLRIDHDSTLQRVDRADVPLLYWLGASWAAAIAVKKDDLSLMSDLYLVEAVMQRALKLYPDFNHGALHEFFIAFDGSRADAMGGSAQRARMHFEAAVKLTKGRKVSPYVSLAENVAVREQNVKEFRALLEKALAIDIQLEPAYRLENVIFQRRARWLIDRIGDLFLDPGEES